MSTLPPDQEYSFAVVVFEVGDRTFRVPRHGFNIPGTNFPLISEDENTPQRLEVDEGRFRALLRAMYPFVGCQEMTINDWLHALDLATEWKLVEVRNRAIDALDNWVESQPAKKVILLAKRYFILSWLKDAYLRLITQNYLTPTRELLAPPSLDWETIGRILGVNLSLTSINPVYVDSFGRCSICDQETCPCQSVILQSNIEEEFKEEFEAIARAWPQRNVIPTLEGDSAEYHGPLHWISARALHKTDHNVSSYAQMPQSSLNPDDITVRDTEKEMQDDEYYFDLVVFKVGNTLFRLPKYDFIIPGTVFEDMFSLPTGKSIEGLDDQNPIILPVQEEMFRGFLHVMHPCNRMGVHTVSSTDWLAALDLSTMWGFHEIRNRAIQALDVWITTPSAKEVVLLAKKYRILIWLKHGYTRLLQQQSPSLTTAELRATPALDWETISRLLSVKMVISISRCQGACHKFVTKSRPSHGCGGSSVSIALASALEQEFREEFSDLRE